MKYSQKILTSSKKVLLKYNAHKLDTIEKANNVLLEFGKSGIKESFREYKQRTFIRSERLIKNFKKQNLNHFDIFRKAGFIADENKFSDAIAAIINPNEGHHLGVDPIIQILKQIIDHDPVKVAQIIQLVKKNKNAIAVHRERHEGDTIPDIEIVSQDFIIFIENKVRGGAETIRQGILQTDRQWDALEYRSRIIDISLEKVLAIYLTPERKIPNNKNFVPLSVYDLVLALKRSASYSNDGTIKSSLLTFLNYYSRE